MKLRRFIAALLVLTLLILDSPLKLIDIAWAADETTTILATDERLLLSPGMEVSGSNLQRAGGNKYRDYIIADNPYIDSLRSDAIGEFNKEGEEWAWFAYKVNAPADGTYTLGLKAYLAQAGCELPLCVNNAVYALSFSGQKVWETHTVEAELTAGEHVIVMFLPMPQNQASESSQGGWFNYTWGYVESMIVDSDLTVMAKPTEAEAEASFSTTISAVDTSVVRRSASVKHTGNNNYLERGTDGARDDKPYIESLLTDAIGQFNASGSDWHWFAYKIKASAAGTYTLGVETVGAKYDSYAIPLVVNNAVYTLSYTAMSQLATTQVTLPAGEHVVLMFMPMPVNSTGIQNNVWNDYPWCNVQSMVVDAALTVMAAPTDGEVEGCFDRKINALDETVVLSNKRQTSETGKLSFSDYNGLRGDLAAIDKLPFAGNLISDWPFASVKVTAFKDGAYTIHVNAEINTGAAAEYIGILVDGTPYAAQYSKSSGTAKITANVTLKKGDHVITFFTPMPKNHSASYSGDWSSHPWVNFKSFEFSSGISGVSKPTIEEIKAALDHTVFAIDSSAVIWSNAMEADPSGGNYLKRKDSGTKIYQDKPQIDSLLSDAFGEFNASGEEWPWFAYKVNAPIAGKYTLGVTTQGCRSASFKMPMYANGEVYTLTYDASKQLQTAEVELAAGDNVVVVFLPMPADDAEAAQVVAGEEYKHYVWCNVEAVVMESLLEVKAAPTAAEVESCFHTAVLPESDSVLANKYDTKDTAVGDGKLSDADATQLRADQPNVDMLPYAANMLGNWPFVSVKVTAPAAGDYTVRVKANVKAGGTSLQLGVLVDGKVRSVAFDQPASDSAAVVLDIPVTLTKGDHVITFFTPMPKDHSTAITNVWNQYPWINFNSIVLSKELSASKPTPDQVIAPLGNTYHAGDEQFVHANLYKKDDAAEDDNDNTLHGATYGHIQWSKYYIDGLDMSQLPRIPYAAIEVTAAEDGTYTILVEGATNSSATASKQLALFVDGVAQAVSFAESANAAYPTVSVDVELTKGNHLLVFTSPMPKTQAEAEAVTDATKGAAYPWFDFVKFHFEKGLAASGDMAADSKEVSVDKTETISKNWSSFKDSDGDGVTDYLSAIQDDARSHRYSIEKLLETGLGRVPHISFTVTTTKAGWYDVYAAVKANSNLTSKYAAMIVDGETVYKIGVAASGEEQLIGAHIPLTAGNHTIVITTAMPETDAEAQALTDPGEDGWAAVNAAYPWFDFYSVTVNGRLTVLSGEKNPLKDGSVLFVGDSITHGLGNTAKGISWAYYISLWNGMDCTNAGVKGATISDLREKIIRHQLMTNAGNDYDYVIMHGGINDAASEVGEMSDSFHVADFDPATYAGGLETMFYYAYENFPNAKLGYIINYATPNANAKWGDVQDMSAYVAVGKQICEKWGIPYIDLYSGEVEVDGQKLSYSYDILKVDTNTNLSNKDAGEIHLSDEGYRVISPYIESWMKSLGQNVNPLKAEDTGKYVSADDEKVLFGGFTAGGLAVSEDGSFYTETKDGAGMLISRVYTGMVEDEASIELLPYAKELLADWAFATIKVNAAEEGDYKIKVEVAAKTAATLGMLVDGKAYTLRYNLSDGEQGYYRFLEQTVHLTAGEHYITVTAAMPETELGTLGDAWNVYPWTNISAFIVDSGLEVMGKPALEDVTAKLGTISDKGDTEIAAGAENEVLAKDFADKGDTLGEAALNDLRWDSVTLDQFTCDNLDRMPYFALKVTAAEDGQYDILLDISTNKNTVSDQIGLLVDGRELLILPFQVAGNTKVKATVTLTKGTHVLVFTTPMPETQAELKAYLEEKDLQRGDSFTYPWMDVKTITLSKGLKVEIKPAVSEVEYPFYNRLEAENSEYVVYNNYNTPNESAGVASGGMVVGGAWNSTFKQTFEELEAWLDAKHNAYVEYVVYAPEAGEYDIRVGFLAGSDRDKTVKKPYIPVIVNDVTYKVQFTRGWGEVEKVKLTVQLKKGLNIIRCASLTTEQEIYKVKGYINHDYLDLDPRLTAVKPSSVTVEAEDSKYINKYKVQDGEDYEKASGKVLGNADRKYMTGLKLTLDKLTAEQLWQVPYFAYTVEAPADGYYPISVNMAGDGRMPQGGTMGILVDGSVNIVNYVRTDKTTTGAKADALVYLTKGEHILTFTVPIPATAGADVNYSYYWSNMDSVTLYNGLVLAKTQKAPATGSSYVRVEVEDHAMFNQSFNNGTASGKAYYLSSQTVAEMLAGGIDGKKTPYAELTVSVDKAGTYTVYLGVNTGMTQGCTIDQIEAKFVVSVNGKLQAKTVHASKSGYSTLIPVEMELKKGANTIQLTHLGKDSQCGGTTWIDFDYVEVSKQLTFAANSDTLEAEKSAYGGYSVFTNDSYSAGSYLGDPDYNEVDESDITFEKLDPADLGELPYVTYRVHAKKAGTYTLTVGFAAGMHKYLTSEIAAGTTSGFAVIVNGETKQLIEYDIASTNTKMSRLITVELLEGENDITFTTTLAEYIIDHVPYVEETYRKVWIDHDYLLLSEGLSGMSMGSNDYDEGDSDFDHSQLTPTIPTEDPSDDPTVESTVDSTVDTTADPTVESTVGGSSGTDKDDDDGSILSTIIWILAVASAVCVTCIVIILCNKKKANKKHNRNTRF